jgi:hypothetical protein
MFFAKTLSIMKALSENGRRNDALATLVATRKYFEVLEVLECQCVVIKVIKS